MEELYGPLPVGKKVVEEAGGDGLTTEEVVQRRPLPNPYLGIGNLNFLFMFCLINLIIVWKVVQF